MAGPSLELTLPDLIVRPGEALRDAMQRMTRNHKGVVFVCDGGTHVVGVLSDGDVRRALLDETLLMAPVSSVMNPDPVTAPSSEQAQALIQLRGLLAVPVVDAEGAILEVVVEDAGGTRVVGPAPADGSRSPVAQELGTALAIVPARGGSRRLPDKNLQRVAGRSLVQRAVDTALGARHVSRVIVSTDSEEIAEHAREAGAEVPWLRPSHLALDDSRTVDVLLHAVETLGSPTEFVALLEPTAPLRTSAHIDTAIEMLSDANADSVLSVSPVPHVLNPAELLVTSDDGTLRPYDGGHPLDARPGRPGQRPAFVQNGLVCVVRTSALVEQRSLYGSVCLPYMTSWDEFLDVDTLADLQRADDRLRAAEG